MKLRHREDQCINEKRHSKDINPLLRLLFFPTTIQFDGMMKKIKEQEVTKRGRNIEQNDQGRYREIRNRKNNENKKIDKMMKDFHSRDIQKLDKIAGEINSNNLTIMHLYAFMRLLNERLKNT
ncbi:hypothetical protein MZM54_03930 [[Brevibacterium] frigoritolerans]|nr:hypothetical protein [Peribacillus frigoritolerans]